MRPCCGIGAFGRERPDNNAVSAAAFGRVKRVVGRLEEIGRVTIRAGNDDDDADADRDDTVTAGRVRFAQAGNR